MFSGRIPGSSRGLFDRSAFRSGYLARKRSNHFPRSEQGLLASARRDPLYRGNLAIPHQQYAIEVVHRGTNVAWKQVKEVSDLWARSSSRDGHGQVLFAWRKWRKFPMPDDHARGYTGIGGHRLVPRIAGDHPRARPAHESC